jgi:hypothetical protein
MSVSSFDLQQRHSWYGQLLLLCLLVLISFALPQGWGYTSSLGYGLLPLLLIQGLGRSGGQVGGSGQGAKRRWTLAYKLLGWAAMVANILWVFTPLKIQSSGLPLLVVWTAFIAWSAVRLIRLLSLETRVNAQVLMGASAGYLLLGITAGLLFSALETVQPGSFHNLVEGNTSVLESSQPQLTNTASVWRLSFVKLNYFAFVTLTSTGFGDILPHSPQAQISTVAIAVIGVFYVAVVMGLLISRLTLQDDQEKTGDKP